MHTKKFIFLTAILLVLGAVFWGVFKTEARYRSGLQNSQPTGALSTANNALTPAPSPETVTLQVNGEPIEFSLADAGAVYDCPTLNTEFETTFVTTDLSRNIRINGQDMANGSCTILLDTIQRNHNIVVTIDGTNYYLRTLPKDFPPLVAQGESSASGYFYTTMGSYVVKFDAKGQVVFYRNANVSDAGPFQRNIIDGEVVYSYLEIITSSAHLPLKETGYRTTRLVLLNEQYQKTGDVRYMAETDKVPAQYPLENHDYLILGKDHYILTTYVGKRVTNIPAETDPSGYGANVVACIFQEIKDGVCVFEWDSTDHPELYAASLEAGDYTNNSRIWSDYAHMNAIVIDPRDNNFVCSFRNLDSILKIDRTTGEILWTLGGKDDDFHLTEEQQFHRQHNVTVTEDGSYLMFDNGCLTNVLGYPELSPEEIEAASQQQYSRAVRFVLDEETMTVKEFQDYSMENFYSSTMGSAQILDDSTDTILIGWGGKSKEGMPLFSEFSTQTQMVNFEMLCYDEEVQCYRVSFFES